MTISKTKLSIPIAITVSLLMLMSPLVSLQSHASGGTPDINIFLGYMDNDHSSANAPTPWCGTSGVQFVGSGTIYNGNPSSTANCPGTYDGGAILIQNTGTTSLTITNFTVLLPAPVTTTGGPTCSGRPQFFNIWFNPANSAFTQASIVVPPGGEVIFAQTSGGGNCPLISGTNGISGNSLPINGYADFDTSDFNFQTSCTPSTDTQSDPQLFITFLGIPTTSFGHGITASDQFIDSGHTLDTGGYDPVNDGCADNESLGWRLNTSTCGESCPGNQIGVPEFPLPIVFIVGIGFTLFLLARKGAFSGVRIPTRMLELTTRWR